MASRLEWPSPFLASVISRSSSGFTAFAFASVVWMRSWSITSRQRFMNSALRCAESRDSFPLCLACLMELETLSGAEVQPARVEGLLDLLDRLAAEVRDGGKLGLGLLHEVADGLDAGPLQAVVRAHAQLELLDQDVVHPARRGTGAVAHPVRTGHQRRALVAQGLHAVGVGEDRQVLDEDLGCLAQRGLRVE